MKKIITAMFSILMLSTIINATPSNENITKDIDTFIKSIIDNKEGTPSMKFNIFCEQVLPEVKLLTGDSCLATESGIDEVETLQKFLTEFTPLLPEKYESGKDPLTLEDSKVPPLYFQKEIKEIPFGINHSFVELTKYYMGYSAEDDLEFDNKNNGYYPAGTIKVFFTEKTLQIIKFYNDIKEDEKYNKISEGVAVLLLRALGHEILHAWQYHKNPYKDLKRIAKEDVRVMIENKKFDEDILKGSYKSVFYEYQAVNLLDSQTSKEFENSVEKIGIAMTMFEEYEKQNPSFFEASGKYEYLSSSQDKRSFLKKYLGTTKMLIEMERNLDEILAEEQKKEFEVETRLPFYFEIYDLLYNGQIVPVYALKKLWKISAQESITENDLQRAKRIEAESMKYLSIGLDEEFPYLALIKEESDKVIKNIENKYNK
ncbi:MAG: hypothetical protein HN833_02400 [Elusimicrobiaceae bacterium]|nr:hypothetical protein [Elusimicrobiaceae bacterium]MBT3954691.1 hypothetical protein [Elusimicrobiaceae bacterium]MBT4008047.1 hypothetical protein [Elusimicrobiaceae bacterium]MBT4402606.1 hypothetical protein [Elusimicrobiaceae bacterium]MBT4439361.1 hypothetical protein [Elusimicrobiaceae bacterium]